MNNLEKIRKAYAMGWAAQFEDGTHVVNVHHVKNGNDTIIFTNIGDSLFTRHNSVEIEELKITGYLYMGQLGGNEPIPEGQRFRIKTSGEIREMGNMQTPGYLLDEYDKEEIEPVF